MTTAFAILGIVLASAGLFYNGAQFGRTRQVSWLVAVDLLTIITCLALLLRHGA